MTFFEMMVAFTGQIVQAWGPFVAFLAVAMLVGRCVIIGRRNAKVRAERRAHAAYRAPVIDITTAPSARASRVSA